MKKTFTSICLILFSFMIGEATAQTYQKQFEIYFTMNDTLQMNKLIHEWEIESPHDAELYIAKFNYYYLKSLSEFLTLSTEQADGSSLVLNDSDGAVAGYLSSQVRINNQILNKAYEVIDQGIRLYPDRLDMRFGKIYLLGEQKDWDNFTSEIIKTIYRSEVNKNEWKWENNEDYSKNTDDFLATLQNYQLMLYDTFNDSLLLNLRTIATEVLKFYPDNVVNLSNVAITYILLDDYYSAIPFLLKATEIDPTDPIILSNLARCYELQEDKTNSLIYYTKLEEAGEGEMQQFAKKKIAELSQ